MKFGTEYDSDHEEFAITLSNELKGAKRVEDKEEDADNGEKEDKVQIFN